MNDVEDVREYIKQLDGEDAVTGFRKLVGIVWSANG